MQSFEISGGEGLTHMAALLIMSPVQPHFGGCFGVRINGCTCACADVANKNITLCDSISLYCQRRRLMQYWVGASEHILFQRRRLMQIRLYIFSQQEIWQYPPSWSWKTRCISYLRCAARDLCDFKFTKSEGCRYYIFQINIHDANLFSYHAADRCLLTRG